MDDKSGNEDVSLATRVGMANDWNADYYISIHHNAGINGGVGGGTIVFVYPGTGGKTTEVQKSIYKQTLNEAGLKGNRSDGTLTADFYVLRATNMPACLIECGFMDSATDIEYILKPEWSKKIARGIAQGICDVFGGTISEKKKDKASVMPAKSFDKKLAGAYMATTSDLKLRVGANTKYDELDSIPKGKAVQCYGYYTKESDGTVWLYVVYNGQVGFVSKHYLA